MPPSLLPPLPRTSPGSSASSTPRAVSSALAPIDLQTVPPTFLEEEELQDNHRGPYSSDSSDHPRVRVIPTDLEERSPSSNDFNDPSRMISTFRNRSRSPVRDEGLRPQSYPSDQLSQSWWSEEYHVDKPKKKAEVTERTEALQSTRKVSNSLIPRWDSESAYLRSRDTLVASLEHSLMSPFFLESRTSHWICIGNRCRYRP
jgi:hypothetical protein